MKVSIKILSTTSWQLIYDETSSRSDVVPEFAPATRYLNSVVPGFGAESTSIVPEGNALVSLSLTFYVTYGSSGSHTVLQSALASIRQMDALLGGKKFHLQIVQDGEVQYYPNATVDNYHPSWMGATVRHQFSFRAGRLTNTEPT